MGYVAQAVARALPEWRVWGTSRSRREDRLEWAGGESAALSEAAAGAEAWLVSTPPTEEGCPAFAALKAVPAPAWIGYLSTTGVYGDLGGGWAFEWSPLAPSGVRSERRVTAEARWRDRGAQVFRLPGIYGPGRSALDRVRAGSAQRIVKPGQVFSRAHVDDIAAALAASIARPNPGRIYTICDDLPAPPQDVIVEACALLGAPPPPEVPFEAAALSPMAEQFYADNKRVSNARAKAELGWRPRYPTYREGLRAILAQETGR